MLNILKYILSYLSGKGATEEHSEGATEEHSEGAELSMAILRALSRYLTDNLSLNSIKIQEEDRNEYMTFYAAHLNFTSPLGYFTLIAREGDFEIRFYSGLTVYCYKYRRDNWRVGYEDKKTSWYEVYKGVPAPTLETRCQVMLLRRYRALLHNLATETYYVMGYEF